LRTFPLQHALLHGMSRYLTHSLYVQLSPVMQHHTSEQNPINDTTVKVKTSELVCKDLLITHIHINLTSDPHFLTATYMCHIKSSISRHTLNFMYTPVH